MFCSVLFCFVFFVLFHRRKNTVHFSTLPCQMDYSSDSVCAYIIKSVSHFLTEELSDTMVQGLKQNHTQRQPDNYQWRACNTQTKKKWIAFIDKSSSFLTVAIVTASSTKPFHRQWPKRMAGVKCKKARTLLPSTFLGLNHIWLKSLLCQKCSVHI